MKYNNLYEHFDSYGIKPDSELKWIGAKISRQLNQDEPYLTQLLKEEDKQRVLFKEGAGGTVVRNVSAKT